MVWNYPEVGPKDSYLLYHEELESLVLNIKGLKRIRFFMTFGQSLPDTHEMFGKYRHASHR